MVVDAHLHFWNPERFSYDWFRGDSDLDRAFLPADRVPLPQAVASVVLVEAACAPAQALDEADWMLDQARSAGLEVEAVVAYAPVEDREAIAATLDHLERRPMVTAVRRVLMGEEDGLFTDPGLTSGLRAVARRGLRFDLAVLWPQLPGALDLVRAVPELPTVLDHLGKPPIRAGWGSPEADQWAHDLRRLAAEEGVHAKLSGLITETPPQVDLAAAVMPFLQHALDVFGPARCMVGTDWPPSTFHIGGRGAAAWLDLVLEHTGLAREERHQVATTTAADFYRPASAIAMVAAEAV